MVARGLSLHAAPMDRDFEERLRIDAQRVRRRSFAVLAGFLASLCFSKDPDDTLQLAVALVFSCVTVRLIPDRWFGRARSELFSQPLRMNGPRPAFRSQPPPAPARRNPAHSPPREGPLQPLPAAGSSLSDAGFPRQPSRGRTGQLRPRTTR